jgi:ATP sulfurylase
MKYIQRKDSYGNFETVDQFKSHKEAESMLKEYRLSDQSAYYYISKRCSKDWQEEDE